MTEPNISLITAGAGGMYALNGQVLADHLSRHIPGNPNLVLQYMPGAGGPELKRMTCMCTYTSDDGFIVDRHPEYEQVMFGCGFSGRGYKFSPVIGETLTYLAMGEEPSLDISFMGATRFAG